MNEPLTARLARLTGLAFVVLVGACIGVSVRPILQPSPAEAGWQLYESADAALGIALPPSWKVVPLTPEFEPALRSSAPDPELQGQLRPVLAQLRTSGVKFFAFDPSTPIGDARPRPFPALAFASRTPSTAASVDAFFAGLPPELTGRAVIDQKHVTGAAGDMVIRRVRETRVRPDGSPEVSVQYQCAVLRGGLVDILTMQLPYSALSAYEDQLEKIALFFAPF
jgi:hypothetical protein